EEKLNEGWRIHQSGNVAEAERRYREVVAAYPVSANAWCYLGMALSDQERYDEAVAAYRQALKLPPNFPIALNNLGNAFRMMRRLDDAVKTFDRAIELKADYTIAYKNKATALVWEGFVEKALQVHEQALLLAPDDPDTKKHVGMLRLMLGDYRGGWPLYEARWKTDLTLPKVDRPLWDGSSVDGQTILLTP